MDLWVYWVYIDVQTRSNQHIEFFFAGGYGFFRSCETRTRKEKFQAWSTHKAPKTTVLKQTTGTCWDMLDIGILSASHVRCQREIIACSVTFALRLFRVRWSFDLRLDSWCLARAAGPSFLKHAPAVGVNSLVRVGLVTHFMNQQTDIWLNTGVQCWKRMDKIMNM